MQFIDHLGLTIITIIGRRSVPWLGEDLSMSSPNYPVLCYHIVSASLFCACLVIVQVSAPYVIADGTHELYTCLFRQIAMLLLKISWCLAYAAQPVMILCCIYLSWLFFLEAIVLPQEESTRSLEHFLSAHCSRL